MKKAKNLELFGRKLDIGEAAKQSQSEEVKQKISMRKVYVTGMASDLGESKNALSLELTWSR